MRRNIRKATLDPIVILTLIAAISLLIIAVFAPLIAPNDPYYTRIDYRLQPASTQFLLGTDHLGRCNLSRLIYGARTSLGSAFLVVTISTIISLVVGVYSGYKGGRIDSFFMRFCDIMLSFPGLILVFALVGVLGPGFVNLLVALLLIYWVSNARLIRGMVLSMKERNYVLAAKLAGTPGPIIVTRHILPYVLPQVVVLATLDIGSVILHTAGFSFLGLGIQPPIPEWGAMLNDSRQFLRSHPSMMLYPGFIIFLVVMIFNILGDRFRDLCDLK